MYLVLESSLAANNEVNSEFLMRQYGFMQGTLVE